MARERRETGNITIQAEVATRRTAIGPDENRLYLAIYNTGANPGRVAFGQEASEGQGVPLAVGGSIVFPNPDSVTHAFIDLYSALGTFFTFIVVSRVPQ